MSAETYDITITVNGEVTEIRWRRVVKRDIQQLRVNLSAEDAEAIAALAEQYGATMSDIVRSRPVGDVREVIATALRDHAVRLCPGLYNFAECMPQFWYPQADEIVAALRERFEVGPKAVQHD